VLKTVDRALRLLLLFDEIDREYRVGEIASMLGTDKSIASRLSATLAKRGFLERAPGSEAFRLGPEFVRLGMLAAATSQNMVEVARVPMERLAEETGETVNLARLEDGKTVNIAQADGPRLVGVGDWIGYRTEPHTTANGKVLLTYMEDPVGTLNLQDPLEAVTAQTITSVGELRAELERVRSEGAAFTIGELEDGFNGVAVPVFDVSGRCSVVLSVSGPEYRMPPERLPEVAALSKGAAEDISARLGRIPQRVPQL
jgi:IclR family acetate operon transcriptional repressor